MKSLLGVILITYFIAGCATQFNPVDPVAFGRKWTLYGLGIDNEQFFYIPETITTDGYKVKYYSRSVSILGYEVIGWYELDCEKNLIRSFDLVRYDKYYRDVGKIPDLPWDEMPKDSVIYHYKNIFCGSVKPVIK